MTQLSKATTIKLLEAASYADLGKELIQSDLEQLSNVSELSIKEIAEFHSCFQMERNEEAPPSFIVG